MSHDPRSLGAFPEPERLARALLEAAPTAIYVFDLVDRCPIFVSPRGSAILEFDPADPRALGPDFLPRTMHPDDWPRAEAHFAALRSAADGEAREFEYRMRAADGAWRWFHSRDVVLARDPDGRPRRILGVGLDITDHKEAEEALRESRGFVQATLDALPEHIAVVDAAGRIIAVNEAWRRFAEANGLRLRGHGVGADYLALAEASAGQDAATGRAMAAGIRAVLAGERAEFALEYPCHSPDELRWFIGRVGRLAGAQPPRAVVAHENITARKLVEETLRESEASFRRLAEAMPQFVWVTEADGALSYVNARWTAFSGLDLAQTNDPAAVAALFHPDDRGRLAAAWAAAFATGAPLEIEARMRGQDGAYRWFLIRGVPVANGNGTRWFGTSTDVTSDKEAEAAVAEGQERLELAQQVAGIGIWDWDIAADRATVSGDYHALMGLDPAHGFLSYEEWLGCIHPEDRARAAAEVAAALAGEGPYLTDFRVVHPDGMTLHLQSRGQVSFDAEGRPARMLGALVDVTARKEAEAARERRRREFEALAEHLPDVVARFDRELRHTYVNAAATAATGIRREDFLGRTNDELGFPPDLVRFWEERSRAAFATAEEQRFDFAFDGPNGARHYEARVVPERGAGGAVETLLAVVTDVSERTRAEEERAAFLDAVAHDVKNPLGVIKAQAQLVRRRLRRGIDDPARLEASLGGIEAGADGASALIDELLDAARLRSGRPLELRLTPVDLVGLAAAAVATAQAGSLRHAARLVAELPALTGEWDAARLERVLANLLGNAVKYSPEGGEVVVRVAREEDATGPWAVLSVRDEGIGIPAADLPHLFERFRRGGNVAGIGGTGIGLAGAKQIAAQHGGTIAVESVEGHGSTFTVRLPLQLVAEPRPARRGFP